jgi:hypothetical protein
VEIAVLTSISFRPKSLKNMVGPVGLEPMNELDTWLAALFDDRVDQYPGSERNLARAIESINLCVAFRAQHRADANAFFAEVGGHS